MLDLCWGNAGQDARNRRIGFHRRDRRSGGRRVADRALRVAGVSGSRLAMGGILGLGLCIGRESGQKRQSQAEDNNSTPAVGFHDY